MKQTTNQYPVKSTNIVSVGYDEVNRILEIEFKIHIIHHYFEVPLSQFIDLMKATNIDDFYSQYVQNKYHFDEI
jgi:KTSC domain